MCEAIGLGAELVGSNDHLRKTFIFDQKELKELPDGFFMMVPTRLKPLVATNLLSWPGKLESLNDLFLFPREQDCTVSDFLNDRFGTEVLEKIAEPMISGIYGADVNRLSLQSALPQIWDMQKRGSIILQLMRRRKAPSESLFTTLERGMESLITRLQEKISADWKMGEPVEEINRKRDQWAIGQELYDAIVIAGSRLPLLEISEFSEVEALWNSIHRNSAIVVVLAFSALNRKGFGWLVPAAERRSILAGTYVSNKFPRRSPDDLFLVRTFIGGRSCRNLDRLFR